MVLSFKPISSSSIGNSYIVTDGKTKILIECGIRFKEIQKALNFKASSIDGCLLTHEHGDHSLSFRDVLRARINIYTSQGTSQKLGADDRRVKTIQAKKPFKIGTLKVLPFEVDHDAEEPLGFLIESENGDRLLFATDTYYIRYRFNNLSIIAVECNYGEEILNDNIRNGTVPLIIKNRLLRSHFSFENYKEFLLSNDLSHVREIWMIHMSETNSDKNAFQKEIRRITGKPTYIA